MSRTEKYKNNKFINKEGTFEKQGEYISDQMKLNSKIEVNNLWSKCLGFIKTKVTEQSFKTWFEPIKPRSIENNILNIQVPSQFFYEWLEEHHIEVLSEVINRELGPKGKLAYSIIIDKESNLKKSHSANLKTETNKSNHYKNKKQDISLIESGFNAGFSDSYLNPKYTFDKFVEGDSNQLASSAAQAISKKPGKTSFNPLMIYGRVGLGKTHIMQAIGHEVKIKFPDKRILYTSSEKFTNQFIEALRNNQIQNFINHYLQIDLLLIDDIQFLTGKEKTQEIFFHIFNHLHQHGKQIVITSDCPPKDLKGLQERLLSRFKWGLTADIQKPDFETRVAIIESKLEMENVKIAPNLVKYIASSIDSNIRELEGTLVSLIAHSSLNDAEINFDLVKQVLNNIVDKIETEVNIDYLQKIVAEYLKISVEDIKGSSRKKEIVVARQIAMHLAKSYTNHSLKYIGEYFGGKHHSTVIHAMQAVEDMISVDSKIRKQFKSITEMVKLKSPN